MLSEREVAVIIAVVGTSIQLLIQTIIYLSNRSTQNFEYYEMLKEFPAPPPKKKKENE